MIFAREGRPEKICPRRKLVAVWRPQWRRSLLALISAAWLGGAAAPARALPVCDSVSGNITTCCRITKAGVYQFTQNVSATKGGDCIRITVPGVALDLGGYGLQGVSATSPIGTGIHVLAAARGAIVTNAASIEDFATGIENDAPKASFAWFTVQNNGNGVLNNGARANFADFDSSLNGGVGFLDTASGTLVVRFTANGNGGNGVVLKALPPPAPAITNTLVDAFDANANSGNGVRLVRAVTNDLQNFSAESNGQDGVQLRASNRNALYSFYADTNGQHGVLLRASNLNSVQGCHADANGQDGVLLRASNQNMFYQPVVGSFLESGSGNTDYGFELKSSDGNIIEGVSASFNGQGGIHLLLSNLNRIGGINALYNDGPGVWLDSAARNTISQFEICLNSTSGIYIGCSATTLPSNVSCGTAPHSDRNVIANGLPQSNNVGVGIDKGNHGNRVVSANATIILPLPCQGANSGYDFADDNNNCDSNLWFNNAFATASQTCIH